MIARDCLVPCLFLAAVVAMLTAPHVARASDSWEDYQEELEDRREEYRERMEDRREAIEEYWEDERERSRHHSHAWYGNYGPYYSTPVAPERRAYGPREFFGPALTAPYGRYGCVPGGACYERGFGYPLVGFGCHDYYRGGCYSFGSVHDCWRW